ncbi:MAG: IS21 family transposase [Acidimicrobiales bacterium]|nr:IS21 family transposase [Acidimicrobiales bacterium]
MIAVEDWAEIRRLYRAEGMGIKAIARRMGVARNTVREAVRSEAPPRYERARKGSIVDAVEPEILVLLKEFPEMPATVIAERIDWPYSIRVLRDRVAELRPLFVAPDPCQRTFYRPGELAQFDLWQPDALIPLGFGQADKLWVVVGSMGFSRFLAGWMVPSREAHDVLGGHLEVLRQFRAVPRLAVWDQEGCIGQWHGPKMVFTQAFQAFRGTLGMGARLCKRNDPETKGIIERNNGYLETSFLPGRRFDDVADFNRQLTSWLVKANQRIHATTKVRPAEAACEDRGAMLGFPAVLPDVSWRFSTRLPRDHYVRVATNDYSVNPRFVGRRIEVTVTLDEVVAHCEGTEVARHRRCLAKHQSLLQPEHARVLRAMRVEAQVAEAFAAADVELRDLSVYDRATGVA